MALQRAHAQLLGLVDEELLERLVAALDAPGDVHVGAELLERRARPELRPVDDVVDLLRLLGIELEKVLLAHLLDPLHGLAEDVDAPGRRRVVERVLVHIRAVLQHRRDVLRALRGELLLDRDNRHAGRAEVLLCAGVEHVELRVVARAGKDVRAHVNDQRGARLGEFLQLRAGDRLVRADVAERGARRPLPLVRLRHAGGDVLLAIGGDIDRRANLRRELLRLLEGLAGPGTLLAVVGRNAGLEEIHRNHRELHRGTALDKGDGPVVIETAKLLEGGDRLLMDRIVVLAAVGHLHHRHAATLVIDKVLLRVLQDFEGENRGTRGKVICSCHFLLIPFSLFRVYLPSSLEFIGWTIGTYYTTFIPSLQGERAFDRG